MKIHIFPFSAREGTPAASFEDQISAAVKKDRCARLAQLEHELAIQFYESMVDEPLEVLVERPSETREGIVRGSDRRYIPVEFSGSTVDVGEFVSVTGRATGNKVLYADRPKVSCIADQSTQSVLSVDVEEDQRA